MDVDGIRLRARVRAPQLRGTAWFNVAERPDTTGRFVLLHFWTSSCANCLHVLDELRPLERNYGNVLTVIGVHSPKFPHERRPEAVASAIERYAVPGPVLSDPDLELWRQYAVKAWPTLVLVDPDGYVVAQAAGEGHVAAIATLLDELVPQYADRLRRDHPPAPAPEGDSTELRFPSKGTVLPAARTGRATDTLLVADAGHRSLVELDPATTSVLRRLAIDAAELGGVTLLPPGLVDYDVLVADTRAHVLYGVRLTDDVVVTTIDLPARLDGARTITGAVPDVLSPWDVAWWPAAGRVVVAAAGVHLLLSLDPVTGASRILAGTTVEGLRDGPALDGWLAQPSGLAVDGERVWFVDAETSALRYLTLDGTLHTAVGEGLFDFGLVDGPASAARLQHPLGVTLLPDGALAVLDTYNGAVRHYDPETGTMSTLARDLSEPTSAMIIDGALEVIESAGHRITRLPVPETVRLRGDVQLALRVDVPPGQVLGERDGPATHLDVHADPGTTLVSGDATATTHELHLTGDGVLHVEAQVLTCDDTSAEHPACHLVQRSWTFVVRLDPDGSDRLDLVLAPHSG